ncbi:MAG: hypothetical protein HWN80_17795 [Candidatus Lokiarchaeota archaeon]|nr:hypothetical protein [Candidatus Lokiarchaeota archaeon]
MNFRDEEVKGAFNWLRNKGNYSAGYNKPEKINQKSKIYLLVYQSG